jgi:ketosteroid isomerase-like protein
MKTRLLIALAGLAISFALPTFAQQTNTPDPQVRQQIVALTKKFDEAMDNNDAAARAALYTEDAVEVTDHGPIFGREAIEKHYADLLQKVQFSNHVLTDDQDSPHIIAAAGKEVWETGGWSCTIQGKDFGPKQLKGYRSVIREGDDLKIRMLIWNITPEPPATDAATPSPTTAPSNQ